MGGRIPTRPLAVIAAAILVAALVALLVEATTGEATLVDEAQTLLWWLGAAVLGGALALWTFWDEHRRAGARAAEAEARAREELQREIDLREEDLRDRDQELDRERRQNERLRARDARERDVNRELRKKLAELQHKSGALGEWRDIPTLVLQTAVALTEAEKGILLTRGDGDGLDVAAQSGFDSDERLEQLAERFGGEALEQDRTLREDDLLAIPIYVRDELNGVIVCVDEAGDFDGLEDEVLLALGDHAGAILQNARLHGELRGSYLATVTMLAEAIQAKDPFLRGHSEEVSAYVGAVAEHLGMDGDQRERLVFGSLLHDVGKIGISERILHKPARLTPEEFAIVQLHPRIGYRLLEQVPALRPMAAAILHHHERYDGGGYPSGLRGEQIPLEARIVAVADAFSAMTADRPYRDRMPMEEACAELERHAGTQFDPEIVRIFCEEVRKAPPDAGDPLAAALDDAELQVHRGDAEPVLGAGALALTDSLTLLYSHRHLHEAAAAESERARLQSDSFVVVLVSVDAVPEVNASRGYADGDALLRRAARALSSFAVRVGATAAREGGIVLGLLVPGGNVPDEGALAGDVADALREDAGDVRVAVARSRPGEHGDAVIARAHSSLAAEPSTARP
ncbi:MAG TPA: HD-GYP domain-containing protein [Solirubrobacteraceae bacterium]